MKKSVEKVFIYSVTIEPCPEGGFFAVCPALRGAHAEGETYAETLDNIEEVIKAHLSLRAEHGERATVSLPVMVRV